MVDSSVVAAFGIVLELAFCQPSFMAPTLNDGLPKNLGPLGRAEGVYWSWSVLWYCLDLSGKATYKL